MRLGGAVHSPTFYRISRSFEQDISSEVANTPYYVQSPDANFNYHLQTPAHYLGSAAFTLSKRGAIDVDYEYVDYTTMKLSNASDGDNLFTANQNIQNLYTHQHNLRAGLELKFDEIYVRGGFGFSSSPYEANNMLEQKTISLGVGFKTKMYFFDVAYRYTFDDQVLYIEDPALVSSSQASYNKVNVQTLAFTFGYKF